jgi:hypothetical protein
MLSKNFAILICVAALNVVAPQTMLKCSVYWNFLAELKFLKRHFIDNPGANPIKRFTTVIYGFS